MSIQPCYFRIGSAKTFNSISEKIDFSRHLIKIYQRTNKTRAANNVHYLYCVHVYYMLSFVIVTEFHLAHVFYPFISHKLFIPKLENIGTIIVSHDLPLRDDMVPPTDIFVSIVATTRVITDPWLLSAINYAVTRFGLPVRLRYRYPLLNSLTNTTFQSSYTKRIVTGIVA